MFMVLSSWQGHCESSPGSFDECRLSASWPPTLKPSQPTCPVSPPVAQIPFLLVDGSEMLRLPSQANQPET